MFRKLKGLRISLLIVFGITTLSCAGIEGIEAFHIADWLCEGTGGTWVITGELHRGKCDRTKNNQANAEGISINSDAEEALAADSASELDSSSDEALAPQPELLPEGIEAPLPDNEYSEAAPAIVDPLPEGNDASILAGTYVGTTNIGETWVGYWGGRVVTDEITIIVADDGTVSGTITSLWTTGPSEPLKWQEEGNGPRHYCVSDMSITNTGTLSGKLIGDSGKIDVQLAYEKVIERFDCPGETLLQTQNDSIKADVIISSNTMSGTMPNGFTFLATKQ